MGERGENGMFKFAARPLGFQFGSLFGYRNNLNIDTFPWSLRLFGTSTDVTPTFKIKILTRFMLPRPP